MGWLECLAWFSGSHSNDATEEAFDAFYAQSVIVPENAPLSEKTTREYFQTMKEAQLIRRNPGILTSTSIAALIPTSRPSQLTPQLTLIEIRCG